MPLNKSKERIIFRKIGRRRDEISQYLFSGHTKITDITYRVTKEYESFEEAIKAKDFKPINIGERWGGGLNGWFKMKFTVPADWKGRRVVCLFSFNGEACVYMDGVPYHGLDRHHQEILLLNEAKGGEKFEIVVEAESGKPWSPEPHPAVEFARAEIAKVNTEVREYWYNLDLLLKLAEELPEESPRRAKIIYTLNKSVDAFDYNSTDDETLRKSALAANEILKPLLDCKATDSAMTLAVVGHSHIDVGWLWPYRETVRKCSRTFSTVLRLMEQYPEFIFSQGQAQLYAFTKEKYPKLYEQIKKRVREGRWDVTGCMWVEADCNLSSGESLVRQVLTGKNFFKAEFGVNTNVLWLPDVFGYSAALPQILKRAGIPYFATNKIHWSQFNKPPYGTFYWKGLDGSRVLAHFPPSGNYNGIPEPKRLCAFVREFQDKDRADEILFTFGHGDGGGGPENNHLELLRREKSLEGLPRCEMKSIPDFFKSIDNGADYHEWSGELYLEYHRGTYTTQARNKKANRRAEFLYRDAEMFGVLAEPFGFPYPAEEIKEQWKGILLHQFHDVIPGTSIRQVYEDTEKMYETIHSAGESIRRNALQAIAGKIDTSGEGKAVVVFNSLSWDRTDIARVPLPDSDDYSILDSGGKEIPSQVAGGEIMFAATVPSCGYRVYRLVNRKPSAKNGLKASKTGIENRFYKIKLDNKGLIKSLILKETGRELIPEGARTNVLQIFEDKPLDWPAWDIDFYYEDKGEDITDVQSIEAADEGPVSASVEICRAYGNSKFKQKIILYADTPRIDIENWVDWNEKQKLLKAAFPADVNANTARYEIQFGNVERPTHRNTSWEFAKFEVCAHKWADISEQGFGLSLMNDCKYGHSANANTISLTLLRSAKEPDPLADMGEHTFTYSLMPHKGNYVEAETVRRAYELNAPLLALTVEPSKGSLPQCKSFISADARNVVLETVKRAENENAVILRFYECHNSRSKVNVKLGLPFKKITECSLMEDDFAEVSPAESGFSFEIKPFEIRTFKLK